MLVRRLIVSVVAILAFGADNASKFTFLTFCNVAVLAVHFLARPYVLVGDNFAESLSVTALTVLTLFLIAAPDPLPQDIAIGVSVMCLVVAVLFLYRMINSRYERLARYLKARDVAKNRVTMAVNDPRLSEIDPSANRGRALASDSIGSTSESFRTARHGTTDSIDVSVAVVPASYAGADAASPPPVMTQPTADQSDPHDEAENSDDDAPPPPAPAEGGDDN